MTQAAAATPTPPAAASTELSRTPCHVAAGCGGFQRSSRTGGAANGIPRNARMPSGRVIPCTAPFVVCARGAAILGAPLSDPAFVRVESSLLRAFESMPMIEPFSTAGTATPRICELRTYESHSNRAAVNKLKMFNAGEIPIFRRAGLTPIFFGETLIGSRMPSLTYMLGFTDMPARDRAWSAFSKDPEWKTLSSDPQYRDNVSAISDIILQPTAYSQI